MSREEGGKGGGREGNAWKRKAVNGKGRRWERRREGGKYTDKKGCECQGKEVEKSGGWKEINGRE